MKARHLLPLLLVAVLVASCQKSPRYPEPKHIVLIGFDGMSSQSLRETGDTIMPFYRSLMARGSYALHKRSVLPSSSACNWASLYMAAGPEQHGYNTWGSRKPDFPSDTLTEHGFFPDLYYQLKQSRPDALVSHFYEWRGIHYVVDTLSIDHDQQFNCHKGELKDVINHLVTTKPLITSIIFNSPDNTGHASGWMSPEYFAEENLMDGFLKQIYDAVEQAGMLDETLFVLTADHGGEGHVHGGTLMTHMESPVVFVGPGIKQGYEVESTVSICDVIPTLAVMLGIERPHCWIGRPMTSIFQ